MLEVKPVWYTWKERQKWFQPVRDKIQAREFPEGPVVKNPPSRARNSGLTPGWGTKVPYGVVRSLSHVQLFATPWTVAYQAPLSMGFSRQEYWSGLSSPSPGDLPNPGIEPKSPALQTDALPSEPPGNPSSALGQQISLSAALETQRSQKKKKS